MTSVTVTVPGKVMLVGEYTVLHGGTALSGSLNGYLRVKGQSLINSSSFSVNSDLWNQERVVDDSFFEEGVDDILCQTVATGRELFDIRGGAIHVTSELNIRHGFGTSSALRLGVLASMHYLSKGAATTPDDSLERAAVEAYRLQKQQQSQASGYDIITQWQGGIVSLVPTPNHWPGTITPYSSGAIDTLNHYVHILVGGKGAPTKTVMNATLDWLQENRALPKLAEISEDMIEEFDHGLTHGQFDSDALKRLFCLFKQHRHTFVGSPCYPESIVSILEAIPDCDSNWSFKTTGAGGEDALILLGPKEILPGVLEHLHPFGWELSPFQFSSVGSQIDFSHEVNL